VIKCDAKPEVLEGGTRVLKGSWDIIWLVTLACALACTMVMVLLFNPKMEEGR